LLAPITVFSEEVLIMFYRKPIYPKAQIARQNKLEDLGDKDIALGLLEVKTSDLMMGFNRNW